MGVGLGESGAAGLLQGRVGEEGGRVQEGSEAPCQAAWVVGKVLRALCGKGRLGFRARGGGLLLWERALQVALYRPVLILLVVQVGGGAGCRAQGSGFIPGSC